MKDEYELPMTVLVDSMEDQSRAMFSDLPSPAFIIDAKGVVREKFPWADAETIGPAVAKLNNTPQPSQQVGVSPVVWLLILAGLVVPLLIWMQRKSSNQSTQETDPIAAQP